MCGAFIWQEDPDFHCTLIDASSLCIDREENDASIKMFVDQGQLHPRLFKASSGINTFIAIIEIFLQLCNVIFISQFDAK